MRNTHRRGDLGTPVETTTGRVGKEHRPKKSPLTSEEVWRALGKASFAVLGYVTPSGEPRSSGVMYRLVDRRLYVVVGSGSWKARHIGTNGRVSVTALVRRGGLLSLVAPIPPAAISFRGTASVHPAGSPLFSSMPKALRSMIPPERLADCSIIEIVPEGAFVTYGIGVPLMTMRDTEAARARVPVTR
jgi:hypothetical protein